MKESVAEVGDRVIVSTSMDGKAERRKDRETRRQEDRWTKTERESESERDREAIPDVFDDVDDPTFPPVSVVERKNSHRVDAPLKLASHAYNAEQQECQQSDR